MLLSVTFGGTIDLFTGIGASWSGENAPTARIGVAVCLNWESINQRVRRTPKKTQLNRFIRPSYVGKTEFNTSPQRRCFFECTHFNKSRPAQTNAAWARGGRYGSPANNRCPGD